MEELRKHRTPEGTDMQNAAAQLALSDLVEPISIDQDELEQARTDVQVSALLKAAETEGACVQREGRQRW
jgi:hypothetical protein